MTSVKLITPFIYITLLVVVSGGVNNSISFFLLDNAENIHDKKKNLVLVLLCIVFKRKMAEFSAVIFVSLRSIVVLTKLTHTKKSASAKCQKCVECNYICNVESLQKGKPNHQQEEKMSDNLTGGEFPFMIT